MTGLRHYDNLGAARFVTLNCHRRFPGLNDERDKQILIEQIAAARQQHRFKLLGYVIMPEHVHLVLHLPDNLLLDVVIGEIKSRSAEVYLRDLAPDRPGEKQVFWQQGCDDHHCHTSTAVLEKIRRCHNNPIERGLVEHPHQWQWSSYNWYQGEKDVPLEMDSLL